MPRRRVLTETQFDALLALPKSEADLIRHYTLSPDDLAVINLRVSFGIILPELDKDTVSQVKKPALTATSAPDLILSSTIPGGRFDDVSQDQDRKASDACGPSAFGFLGRVRGRPI